MSKLVMNEECRTLFCDIDLGELRVRALYDAKCSVWQSAHLRHHAVLQMFLYPRERHPMSILLDHEERTDQPHSESTWFLRPRAASFDNKRMPIGAVQFSPHDWTLSITRVRHFCAVFAAQVEAMYKPKSSSHSCLLSVCRVKLRKSRIKSQSPRPFHKLSPFCCSFHLCPTIMTTSSSAICLCLVSREQGLQELHRFAAPNIVLTSRPLCGWHCAQTRETCSSTRIRREKKRKGGTSAARRMSSKARTGQMPGSASGDPMEVVDSQSTADGTNGSERTRGNQSVDSLTHRLERLELLNNHRDELLPQCAQSRHLFEAFLCRTWLVEGDVAWFQPFAAARAQGKA